MIDLNGRQVLDLEHIGTTVESEVQSVVANDTNIGEADFQTGLAIEGILEEKELVDGVTRQHFEGILSRSQSPDDSTTQKRTTRFQLGTRHGYEP